VGWVALLDTCVLYPSATRDLLLRGSERGLFQIRWSDKIIDELARSLIADKRCTPDQAAELVRHMRVAFPEAVVSGYQELVPAMANRPGDRHVLAAALVARADVIVTDNTGHFPTESCESYAIEVQTADEFLSYSFDLAPDAMAGVFLGQIRDFKRPKFDVAAALSILDQRLPAFAARVRESPQVTDALAQGDG
jgi:predicted nucleic acid-binding protein